VAHRVGSSERIHSRDRTRRCVHRIGREDVACQTCGPITFSDWG
jgi:hypothetical protein